MDHKKEVWRSRIVGRDDVAPTLLAAHPLNYRKHPKQQRGAVAQVLSDVGWVQEVIVSKRTGRVLDGHLRLELALEREEPTIPVKFVDLDEEEEARVLLSFDALGGMAQVDNGALDSLIAAAGDGGAVDALLNSIAREHTEYTQKIVTPIYEPSGTVPAVADLYDGTVTGELLAEIEATDLPEDVRAFLDAAARRHTVLWFDRIADFYAAAPPELQRLMERSALVIVDANAAIERGFLRLHDDILESFREDYPSA